MANVILIRTTTDHIREIDEELAKLQCCAQCADDKQGSTQPGDVEFVGLHSSSGRLRRMLASFLPGLSPGV